RLESLLSFRKVGKLRIERIVEQRLRAAFLHFVVLQLSTHGFLVMRNSRPVVEQIPNCRTNLLTDQTRFGRIQSDLIGALPNRLDYMIDILATLFDLSRIQRCGQSVYIVPRQSDRDRGERSVDSARRERRNTRRLNCAVEGLMEELKSLIVRSIAWSVDIEERDD